MTSTELNLAPTGASALGADFTSSYEHDEAARLVLEDGTFAPHAPLSFTYSLSKRTLDLVLASVGLFILSPFY